MRLLHIANADLEFELAETKPLSLEASLKQNPIIHQLQYLPMIYAEKDSGLAVTDRPDPEIHEPLCHLLSEKNLPYTHLESWAPSKRIAQWARERNLSYKLPPWDVVKEVNSKAFSFEQTTPLPGAALLHTLEDVVQWDKHTLGAKVLKTCFGVSGTGHLHLPAPLEKMKSFALREFNQKRPILAEPWVPRKLDFSTQWIIGESIEYVGATILQSDQRGHYLGNLIGPEAVIFGSYFSKLEEHKVVAQTILQKMKVKGFFGNVGFDAMIWGDDHLHPVVEINARKTMGWISLQIAKRLFSNHTITVSYGAASCRLPPLLPQGFVDPSGAIVKFSRNLYADILAN